MPLVNIKIYAGHPKARKDELAKRLTDAICEVMKVPREGVWIVLEEIDPPNWFVGAKPGERMKEP